MKIKIAFDIVDIWENFGVFRDVLRDMSLDTDEVDLTLITTSTNNDLVISIYTYLGMEVTKVFQVADNDAILAKLTELKTDIYLASNNVLNNLINDNATDTESILVDSIPDRYKLQPKWVTNLQFWIDQFNKLNRSASKEC